MWYFVTAVIAFLVGAGLVSGVTYWNLKELGVILRILVARLERLEFHKEEILNVVDNKRWWETLLDDIDDAKKRVEEEASKVI